MSENPAPHRVRSRRLSRGWSQLELAERAGISRTAVSAIEGERLVPSVAAALALAEALGCTVEELFGRQAVATAGPDWAWPPVSVPGRYWAADVRDRVLLYPVEPTGMGIIPHDGVSTSDISAVGGLARQTLVIASCDPAAGLLAAELARAAGVRLLILPRSSRKALELLGQGLVHAAGVHLAHHVAPDGGGQ